MSIARDQLQSQLDRLVAVATHAFDRQELRNDHVAVEHGHFLSLDAPQNDGAFFPGQLQGTDHRGGAPRSTVNDQIGHLAARDVRHALQQILLTDRHGVVRPQTFGQSQALEVRGVVQAGHDDVGDTCFTGCNHTRQALLTRALNQHSLAGSCATLQIGPLDAVRHGQCKCGVLGINALWHFVKDRVHVQFLVLRKTTPQTRADAQTCCTVPWPTQTPVGGIAQTEITAATKFTMAAREVFLQSDQITFFDAPLWTSNGTDLLHIAHSFVTQNSGALHLG